MALSGPFNIIGFNIRDPEGTEFSPWASGVHPEMGIPLLADIVIIFGMSIGVLFVCSRLRVPSIVGFLLTGVLAGPYGP